ncbi:MAG: hypothetical protein VX367_11920, partial [SAR324 cluster bacterium]|nr:hypothetical protein [SAR324 cluster bacterium]
ALSSSASVARIKKLTSRLPADFYGSFTPRQRFELARQVLDMGETRRLADEQVEARRAVMAANDEKAKSEKLIADLRKQLAAAVIVDGDKAKAVADSVERSKAAINAKFTTASKVRPQSSLAPIPVLVPPPAAAFSASSSRPADSNAVVAPTSNKKQRLRRWNQKAAS